MADQVDGSRDGSRAAMSLAAFGRRRGITAQAVSSAIRDGRLTAASVTRVNGVPKISDPDVADRELDQNTAARIGGAAAAAAPRDQAEYYAARARREVAAAEREVTDAALAKLKLAERQGELVLARDIESHWVTLVTNSRQRLLAIPARVRQRDSTLTSAQIKLIESLIVEALEDLADSAGADDDDEAAAP